MGPSEVVQCPQCRHSNAPGSLRCAQCNAPFLSASAGSDEQQTMVTMDTGWSLAPSEAALPATSLTPGMVLAGRYEILQLIGEGGMGAVYKARDRELDRIIGLKVIRPELARKPKVLQRFKQELILARQVTHRNVIRIFDLGVADNIKFITMEFIEGRDLSAILEERKFTHHETAKIVRQVARAL